MQAITYSGTRHIAVVDHAEPDPGPNEVQIAVSYVGICGVDLHILHGEMDARIRQPAIIGHEVSGTVAALGAQVTGLAVGDTVITLPTHSCGTCVACLRGNGHICHELDFVGIDSPGGMRSRWTVPMSRVIRVPDEVPVTSATFIEPLSVAVHAVRRAGLTVGQSAVVVGGGAVGVLIALVAKQAGARVLLVEPGEQRRTLAGKRGIAVCAPADADARIADLTRGAGADVAFEVSGTDGGVNTAIDSLTSRGKFVLVAIHPIPEEVNLHRIFVRELELVGARLYSRDDVETAITMIAAKEIDVLKLLSAIIPMDRAEDAFAAFEAGDVLKVLLDFGASDDTD